MDGQFKPLPPKEEPVRPTIDAEKIWSELVDSTPVGFVDDLSGALGVTTQSLLSIGCAWSDKYFAFAFPMRDGFGNVIGIRLRNNTARKWAVTGSRQGLFIPNIPRQDTAYITEGPTDTASMVSLGLFAIGRPSCNACVTQTVTALRQKKASRAVIFSDNDGPGLQGAQFLSKELPIPSCIFVPPCKDAREFKRLGGTSQLVESMVNGLVWNVPEK